MSSPIHAGSTNYALLNLLQKFDEQFAWNRFLQLYRPMIRDCCQKRSLDSNAVDEVESMVMNRLLAFFTGGDCCINSGFRGFLTRIVENEIHEYLRECFRKHSKPFKDEHFQLLTVLSREDREKLDDLEAEMIGRFMIIQEVVESVRSQVDPKTWNVFWDYSIAGMSYLDVAAKYDVSKSAVFKYQKRVINRLKAMALKRIYEERPLDHE